MIDSSVLIAAERGAIALGPLLKSSGDELVVIPAITASELLHGLHRLKGGVKRARVETLIEGLLARIPVVALTSASRASTPSSLRICGPGARPSARTT